MLRAGLVTPIHSYTFRLAACGLVGTVISLAATAQVAPIVPVPVLEATEELPMQVVPLVPAPRDEVRLVFRERGALYLKLRDADPMPAHGTPVLHEAGEASAWRTTSIAEIADIPGWRGKRVEIDGTCTATVTGFAVVARLTGSPDYTEGNAPSWTAENVLDAGAPVVAAKLAGCESRADVAIATTAKPLYEIRDEPLVERARATLLGSSLAAAQQRVWAGEKRKGTWYAPHAERSYATDGAAIETLVAEDAHGTRYVSVVARIDEGCGGPEIAIWGLYRVSDGALVVVAERALGDVRAIQRLVDVDGDGELEVLGTSWLGNETILWRFARDEEITRVTVPFYGCPC